MALMHIVPRPGSASSRDDLGPEERLFLSLTKHREEEEALLRELVRSKDAALDQLEAVRELAEKSMAQTDAREVELRKLQALVVQKDIRLAELEQALGAQGARVAQLEATLKMLAEAELNG